MQQGKNIKEGHLMQGDKTKNQKRIHPTEKPTTLYSWLLKKYAKEGYKILDTHGGSMSHAIACYDLDFNVYLDICEKDKIHFEDAKKRFEWHKRQLKLEL